MTVIFFVALADCFAMLAMTVSYTNSQLFISEGGVKLFFGKLLYLKEFHIITERLGQLRQVIRLGGYLLGSRSRGLRCLIDPRHRGHDLADRILLLAHVIAYLLGMGHDIL